MLIDRKATLLGFSVVSFFAGLYFCLTFDSKKKELFTGSDKQEKGAGCPDLLVRKGTSLLLYNTQTPDADPMPFYNLDEYINYLEDDKKVKLNGGYPTIFKVLDGRVEYYEGPRTADKLAEWVGKVVPGGTKKRRKSQKPRKTRATRK